MIYDSKRILYYNENYKFHSNETFILRNKEQKKSK